MGFTRPLWVLPGHYGFYLAIMGFTWLLWVLLGHDGFYLAIMGCDWPLLAVLHLLYSIGLHFNKGQ